MIETRRDKILIGAFILLVIPLMYQILKFSSIKHSDLSYNDQQFIYKWEANSKLNKIYAITPTYSRIVQKAELTRISHVVQLSPNVHWIIVEDSTNKSELVRNVLKEAGLEYRATVLNEPTPEEHKHKVPTWLHPRGVSQRNVALQWIRDNVQEDTESERHSVVYFMDDDNTYSLELFQEMAKIERGRVGVWPVALVGKILVERPLIDPQTNKVVGFNSKWRPEERPFPVDMASFAISLDLLLANPEAKFSYDVQHGLQETAILRHVTTIDRMQPLANLCKKVLVWHTKAEVPKLEIEEKLAVPSDDGMEV